MSADIKDAGDYRSYSLEDEEKEMLVRILDKYQADRSHIQEEEKELGKRLESLRISLRTLEGKISDLQGLINEDQKQPQSALNPHLLETEESNRVNKKKKHMNSVIKN
mgnify:CR=1 FL=1